MKMNSIIFRMMVPLIIITMAVMGITLLVTQTYLKKVMEDIFVELQIHHLEEVYRLKLQNTVYDIKEKGIAIASSKEVREFILSGDAANKKVPYAFKEKLAKLKNLYELDTIYVADKKSRNYYNENGFVEVVDPKSSESAWFLKTLKSDQRMLINADSDITGTLHLWADVIVGDISSPIGLAGCGEDISDLYQIALKDFGNENADVTILNSANIIKGSSKYKELINRSLMQSSFSNEKVKAILDGLKTKKNYVKYEQGKDERYLLFVPFKTLDWKIVIDISKVKFLATMHGVYDRIIAGGLVLLLLLAIIGGITFTFVVSRPLMKISQEISKFDPTTKLKLSNCKSLGYELSLICRAFKKSSRISRQMLERYKSNEELVKSIINSADDLIIYKDEKSRYMGCNDAYLKWHNKTMEEIIGKTDNDFYPPSIAENHIMIDKQVLKDRRTIITEEKYEKKDGSTVILQVKKSPFYDIHNQVKGLVIVARDVTVEKNLEQELRTFNAKLEEKVAEKTKALQETNTKLEEHIDDLGMLNLQLIKAKEAALQAAQARSNFISGVSHELRTPLNAIINFTDQVIEDFDEMLQDKELQEESRRFLSRVMVNSKHLLQLINDLLEFTKAEAGKMEYKIEKNDVFSIVKMAFNNTYSLLNGTQVEFFLKLNADKADAMIDTRRFLQVLINLLSNAVKFTQAGYIEVRGFIEEDNIIVEIEDTGKGIPKEKQQVIYEPFVQANSMDTGTGLGLGLARRMCDDMGIDISFVSEVDKGTTFRLSMKKA